MSELWGLLAALVLLALNGFFVAAEFALLASRSSRLENLAVEGSRRAKVALAGKRELSLMLAGAQLGITICSLLLGAVAEPALAHLLESGISRFVDIPEAVLQGIGFAIALSIVVLLHMVIGEMAPKSWAIAKPEKSVLLLAVPFRGFALVVRPVIVMLNVLANGLVRLFGVAPQDELAMAHSPADLMLLLDESADQGSIDADEHQLFSRSLTLSGRDAEDAMVPRRKVVAVPAEAGAQEMAAAARTSGRSRIVVYEGDLDHVVGIFHIKDLLTIPPSQRAELTARDIARPAQAVHESRSLEDVLVDMRSSRQHLFMVVDEHGIVSGVIALEDVIEELIGDFEDESDRQNRSCRRLPDGSWSLSGDLRPDELEEYVDISLPEGDWETLAGFVIDTLQRLPEVGDQVVRPNFTMEVMELDGYAVAQIRLVAHPSADTDDDGHD
jgi:CBS domain containing-hemolysin-like protein